MNDTITVAIADSFEIVREAVSRRLSMTDGIEVIGEAADGYSTLKLCRSSMPDVLLMDLGLTKPRGIEILEKLNKSCPDTMIVALSSDQSFTTAMLALSQGAVAFVPKQAKGADFVSAVKAAASGYTTIPTQLLEHFVQSQKNASRTGNAFGLSPREVQIMEACANGESNKGVANKLNISVRTVETHRNNINRKTASNSYEDIFRIVSSAG